MLGERRVVVEALHAAAPGHAASVADVGRPPQPLAFLLPVVRALALPAPEAAVVAGLPLAECARAVVPGRLAGGTEHAVVERPSARMPPPLPMLADLPHYRGDAHPNLPRYLPATLVRLKTKLDVLAVPAGQMRSFPSFCFHGFPP